MTKTDAPAPDKYCRYCRGGLEPEAVFCTACGKFQDYRRFLNVGNTFLALMIALISVITALGPTLVDLFTKPSSEITFAVIEQNGGDFVVLARNTGNRDAVIGGGEIAFHLVGAYPVKIITDTRMVKGGDVVPIRIGELAQQKQHIDYALRHNYWFEGRGISRADARDEAPRSGNLIGIEVIAHDGCRRTVPVTIPGPLFSNYLEYHFPSRAIPAPDIPEPEVWEQGAPRLSGVTGTCR